MPSVDSVVVQVATPPLKTTAPQPLIVLPPSVKFTVPVGVPVSAVTVAVRVTELLGLLVNEVLLVELELRVVLVETLVVLQDRHDQGPAADRDRIAVGKAVVIPEGESPVSAGSSAAGYKLVRKCRAAIGLRPLRRRPEGRIAIGVVGRGEVRARLDGYGAGMRPDRGGTAVVRRVLAGAVPHRDVDTGQP